MSLLSFKPNMNQQTGSKRESAFFARQQQRDGRKKAKQTQQMDDEADPGSRTSYRHLMMDVEVLQEEQDINNVYSGPAPEDPKGSISEKRQHSGKSRAESELHGAESCSAPAAYLVCVDRGEEDVQDKLLPSCCTAEGSTDQASPNPMLEYWVYLDNQQNMADCPVTKTITPPATPVTCRPCPFIPIPSLETASSVSSGVNPMVSSPVTDTCSPISSMCSPTGSACGTLRSISTSPDCSDRDPVSAAAHLHLLGESLSLIGHHLQETNKMVSMSSSLSLLLDSLLCALAPLICLTAEIPELRSYTHHTLTSTLENIAYLMPGL